MKRILFFILTLCLVMGAAAQIKDKDIQVFTVNPKPLKEVQTAYGSVFNKSYNFAKITEKLEPIRQVLDEDIYVYSFKDAVQRERFMEKYFDEEKDYLPNGQVRVKSIFLNCNDDEIDASDYVGRAKLDVEGMATVKAYDNAVFLVPYDGLKNLEDILDKGEHGKGIENRREMTIYVPLESKQEVEVKERLVIKERGRELSSPFEIHWRYDYIIDSLEANPDIRLGFRPVVKEYESGGIFKLIAPKVVDGKNFHTYQMKRMGYDYKKNDPLGKYCDESILVQEYKNDTVHMRDVIGKKVQGKHYTIDMTLYEMSHDGVLDERTFQVYDGRERIPLRFVEFQFNTATLDTLRYRKRGVQQSSSDSKDCNLPFKVGAATLDPDDELGQRKLAEAAQFAREIAFRSEISDQSFTIEGFASPEGDYRKNQDLALRRAMYLRDQIRRQPNMGGQQMEVKRDAVVQPWTVVADSLRNCGYEEEAAQVQAICESTHGMEAQYQKIRQLACYPVLIKDSILPKLRVSRINADYTISRVLPAEEVYQRYDANPVIYLSGAAEAYEYYHLMRRFEDDFEKLEPLARVAYNKFKDDFDRDQPDSLKRRWTMAAYHLARCQVRRRVFDEKLLKPYLVKGLSPNFPSSWDARVVPPWNYRLRGNPCNDPAVALLQIETLCSVGKYKEADSLFLNCMDTKKFEIVGTFIECMADPSKLLDDPAAREKMAATSKWNKLVVYAALCGFSDNPYRVRCVDEALKLVKSDTITFREDDPRFHYLRARLMFDRLCDKKKTLNMLPMCQEMGTYQPYMTPVQLQKSGSMIGCFMKAFMLEENFLTEELRWDGYIPWGLYEKAREYWYSHDPTKMRLPEEDFVKKFAKPHPKKEEEATTTEKID